MCAAKARSRWGPLLGVRFPYYRPSFFCQEERESGHQTVLLLFFSCDRMRHSSLASAFLDDHNPPSDTSMLLGGPRVDPLSDAQATDLDLAEDIRLVPRTTDTSPLLYQTRASCEWRCDLELHKSSACVRRRPLGLFSQRDGLRGDGCYDSSRDLAVPSVRSSNAQLMRESSERCYVLRQAYVHPDVGLLCFRVTHGLSLLDRDLGPCIRLHTATPRRCLVIADGAVVKPRYIIDVSRLLVGLCQHMASRRRSQKTVFTPPRTPPPSFLVRSAVEHTHVTIGQHAWTLVEGEPSIPRSTMTPTSEYSTLALHPERVRARRNVVRGGPERNRNPGAAPNLSPLEFFRRCLKEFATAQSKGAQISLVALLAFNQWVTLSPVSDGGESKTQLSSTSSRSSSGYGRSLTREEDEKGSAQTPDEKGSTRLWPQPDHAIAIPGKNGSESASKVNLWPAAADSRRSSWDNEQESSVDEEGDSPGE